MPDELDHGNLIQLIADGDRETRMMMGVFRGNASLAVFANNKMQFRLPLNRAALIHFGSDMQKILDAKPGEKFGTGFTKWNPESKKQDPLGTVYIGRDEKGLFYIGIAAVGSSPIKFLVRTSPGFDRTSEPMAETDRSLLAMRTLIQQLSQDLPMAMMLTSYKRQPMNNRPASGAGGAGGRTTNDDNMF